MREVIHISVGATTDGKVAVIFHLISGDNETKVFDRGSCKKFISALEDAYHLACQQGAPLAQDGISIGEETDMRIQ